MKYLIRIEKKFGIDQTIEKELNDFETVKKVAESFLIDEMVKDGYKVGLNNYRIVIKEFKNDAIHLLRLVKIAAYRTDIGWY